MKIHEAVPDVYIIGAQRSGTTWLYEELRRHPDVWGPNPKPEPKIFLPKVVQAAAGTAFFRRLVVDELEFRGYTDSTDSRLLVEKCTRYLADPKAAKTIHRANPEAKIIVIGRDPSDRAWSHYRYSRAQGVETLPYKVAVASEAARATIEGSNYHKFAYLGNGLVATHLERTWLPVFCDQVLVLRYEDLENPCSLLNKVFQFLGLSESSWARYRPAGIINEGQPMDELVDGDVLETAELIDWLLIDEKKRFSHLAESVTGRKNAPDPEAGGV